MECDFCDDLKHIHCFKCGVGFSYKEYPLKASKSIYLFEGESDVQEGDFIRTWVIGVSRHFQKF